MFKAIAAIATAIAALATAGTAFLALQAALETNRSVTDTPPPGVERPNTPAPDTSQPTSLDDDWFYDGGYLDVYFDSVENGFTVYDFDDYNNQDEIIGAGILDVDVDAGTVFIIGFGGPCGEDNEYEGEFYLLDSWGIEGELTCILSGGTRGVGYYR